MCDETATMNINKTIMSRYKKENIIGSGTFGIVYLVKLNKVYYALKEIKLNSLTSVEKQRAFNEASLLAKLKHRNVIEYKESVLDFNSGNLLIVTEYAGCGDLSNAIVKQKGIPFTERQTISWFVQISLALQYIHSQNILHRDLKTHNIFLCKDNSIKVGDFGIARALRESEAFAYTSIGTPYYLSPEICLKKPYNLKSDMWALGCVLFEISALERPFTAESFPHLMSLILEGKRKTFPDWSTDLVKKLVENLLCFDPDKRPSTDEILEYPTLQVYLLFYAQNSKGIISGGRRNAYRGPEDGLKRSESSASTLNSNCSKRHKFSPKPAENEQKQSSASTRATPPIIVVTEYNTPGKFWESGRKLRSASTHGTPPESVVTENKENGQKPCIAIPRATPPGMVLTKDKENKQKLCTTSTRATPPAIVFTKDKIQENKRMSPFSYTRATLPATIVTGDKTPNKVLNSKPNFGNKSSMNVTYTVAKKSNSGKGLNSFEIPCASTPNDRDWGYSSEINCSADSTYYSICEHSMNDSESKFSILEEHEDKSNDLSHCSHSQCHQCMIDMMWKNRIRGCASISGKSDYLKLKKKLLLIFKQDLFKKLYESLLLEWEGNESCQTQASIRSYAKLLNYEQVQHLPLMMQLIQLDLIKSPKVETYTPSNELVII